MASVEAIDDTREGTGISGCSVVIPNYNGEDLLRRHLPSVLADANIYPGPVQIIVVDDASTDGSVDVLRTEFPAIELVCHNVNRGFADAIQTGVDHAIHELVFLLNSDVSLLPGCLATLQTAFEDEKTFAAGPLILNEDDTVNSSSWPRSRFVRGHLKLLNAWESRLHKAMEEAGGTDKFPTPYCSGGSVMLRKRMFQALEGFSPIFKPFYYEDFDLGLRAWYRGWPSYFVPGARVLHEEKGSIENHFKSDHIKCMQRRNRYFLEWVHFPLSRLLFTTWPFMLLRLVGELAIWDKKNLKAFCLALANIKEALARRRQAKGDTWSLPDVMRLTGE